MFRKNKSLLAAAFFICITVAACTSTTYTATNKVYKKQAKAYAKQLSTIPTDNAGDWIGTVNFNLRKPNIVIIHHTAQKSCEETLKTFTLSRTQVSAHYVICKDGTVHHMLNDYLRAWHGGIGKWGNITDLNSVSIGIELDNEGYEKFPDVQIKSLLVLLDTLKKRYNIPAANFIGHLDVAPARKTDPNINFPWQQLSEKGFGLWYGNTNKVNLPPAFDYLMALRTIGYDVSDSTAAIQAFKRHYTQDSTRTLTVNDQKIIWLLSKKAP